MSELGVVYVVDGDPPLRSFIEETLGKAGYALEVHDSTDALLDRHISPSGKRKTARPEGGQVLVLDLEAPGSGLDMLAQLRDLVRSEGCLLCPVVALAAPGAIGIAVESMKLGAEDVLEKPVAAENLVRAVAEALARDRAAHKLAGQRKEIRVRISRLSKREREILHEIVAGHSTKVIADNLGIAPRTVDHHRASLTERMQAMNVADLVRMVIGADFGSVPMPSPVTVPQG